MLLKCYTQYVSKFGKLSSGHRTGKGQLSFQSQRKAMPKNAQTTAQFHSSHMLTKVMLKILQARLPQYVNFQMFQMFSNFQYENFQMFKLNLEKAEEPEIKLPTSIGSSKKQVISRKTSISVSMTMQKPLTVWITINWKILKEMGIPDL